MGKNLIIKGADFSANAVDVSPIESTLVQGIVVSVPTSANYGKLINSGSLVNTSIATKVLIQAGSKINIVVYNNNTKLTDLMSCYASSPENMELIVGSRLNTSNIVEASGSIGTNYRLSDGSFELQNTTAQDLYYYINFSYDLSSEFSVVGKTCFYKKYTI